MAYPASSDALPAPLLSYDDVAAVLNVSRRTVVRLVESGALRAMKVRRCVRVRAEDVAAFIDAQPPLSRVMD